MSELKKIQLNECVPIFNESWDISYSNYGQAILYSIILSSLFVFGAEGFMGPAIAFLVGMVLLFSTYLVSQKWKSGVKTEFSEFFAALLNPTLFHKVIKPICIFAIVDTFCFKVMGLMMGFFPTLSFLFIILGIIVAIPATIIIFLAAPLIIFKDMELEAALKLATRAALQNILPLLVIWGLYFAVTAALFLFFVYPGILIGIPLSMHVNYLVFEKIFA